MHRRLGMQDGIRNKLAGQQFCVGEHVVAGQHLPRSQRLPDEAARGGHRSRLGVIGCGRNGIHVSCPLGTDGHVRWHLQ
jgi:hypothetical protein